MASHLLKAAAAQIRSKIESAKRATREKQKETALIVGSTVSVGLTVAAAIADQKMGLGHQWKLGPVPVNAIAGVVALVPAFFMGKMPIAQAVSVQSGMTLLNVALYRFVLDNVDAGTP